MDSYVDAFKLAVQRYCDLIEEFQAHKADGLTNRERRHSDFLTQRTILRANRERRQRHHRHSRAVAKTPMLNLGLPGKIALPFKFMSTRVRTR